MTLRIIRNAGGVPGLMVALNVFSEEVEKRVFQDASVFYHDTMLDDPNDKKKKHFATSPFDWNQDIFSLCNLVSDSGLLSEYFTPDYSLGLTYPIGAGFQAHYDSRHRWGETVVGVTLGQGGTMYFTSPKGETVPNEIGENYANDFDKPSIRIKEYKNSYAVELDLPRRSMYIMTRDARLNFKHGLRAQNPKRFASPPDWNPNNYRRSITLRHTKCFSDICLEFAIINDPTNEELIKRLSEQNKYKPSVYYNKLLKKDEIIKWRTQMTSVYYEMKFGRLSEKITSRFSRQESECY
jgi:alkylated DNA repair dioxygenase AlkB